MIRIEIHILFYRPGIQASPNRKLPRSYIPPTLTRKLLSLRVLQVGSGSNTPSIQLLSVPAQSERSNSSIRISRGHSVLSAHPSYLAPAASSVLNPTNSQLNTFGESHLQGSYSILFGFSLLLPRLRESLLRPNQNPGGSSCLHPHLGSSGITSLRQTLLLILTTPILSTYNVQTIHYSSHSNYLGSQYLQVYESSWRLCHNSTISHLVDELIKFN